MRIACGMKLRGEDPVGMKDFIHSVQQRVNELKASSGDGQANMSGKRVFSIKFFKSALLCIMLPHCNNFVSGIIADGVHA